MRGCECHYWVSRIPGHLGAPAASSPLSDDAVCRAFCFVRTVTISTPDRCGVCAMYSHVSGTFGKYYNMIPVLFPIIEQYLFFIVVAAGTVGFD